MAVVHPDLKSRTTEKLELSNAIACTETNVHDWFHQLPKLMKIDEVNKITSAH